MCLPTALERIAVTLKTITTLQQAVTDGHRAPLRGVVDQEEDEEAAPLREALELLEEVKVA
jgi:hypothetical protein